jgi:hypothetical protein
MNNRIRFFTHLISAGIFIGLTVFIYIVDFGIFKASGGGGGLILFVGSVLALILEGEIGRIAFSAITVGCALFNLYKASKYKDS